MGKTQVRILFGLTEVAGYWTRIMDGFGDRIEVTHIELNPTTQANKFRYSNTRSTTHCAIGPIHRLKYLASGRGQLARLVLGLAELPFRIHLMIWAMMKNDVFVFGYNCSFLRLWDLPILRLFGKRTVCVYFGSDHRPPFMDGARRFDSDYSKLVRANRTQKRRVKWVERWADVIVANPLSAQYHERPFVRFVSLGNPVPAPQSEAHERQRQLSEDTESITIMHAPSDPEAKGTQVIDQLLEKLMDENKAIIYVKAVGWSNREVLDGLARSDLAIDQVWSDVPYSTFGGEASSIGTPCVVGGYGLSEMTSLYGSGVMSANVFVHPDDLESAVRMLVVDAERRQEIGKASSDLVTHCWSSEVLATHWMQVFNDQIPPSWMCDPNELAYFHGACLSETQLAARAAAVVRLAGTGGLQLDDKPEVKRKLLEFLDGHGFVES